MKKEDAEQKEDANVDESECPKDTKVRPAFVNVRASLEDLEDVDSASFLQKTFPPKTSERRSFWTIRSLIVASDK